MVRSGIDSINWGELTPNQPSVPTPTLSSDSSAANLPSECEWIDRRRPAPHEAPYRSTEHPTAASRLSPAPYTVSAEAALGTWVALQNYNPCKASPPESPFTTTRASSSSERSIGVAPLPQTLVDDPVETLVVRTTEDSVTPEGLRHACPAIVGSGSTLRLDATPRAIVSPMFQPLVEQLEMLRSIGNGRPSRSSVASDLIARNKQIHEQAGVNKFRQYVSTAEKAGIVQLGRTEEKDWISLHPSFIDGGKVSQGTI